MNAADFLAAASGLPIGTLAEVTNGGGLVIVAPHPDDESLGCGALIAAACADDVAVRVVVVSDGVGSHRRSRHYPPVRLRELREEETRCAVAELGLAADALHFLRLPDGDVPTQGVDANTASDTIAAAAREVKGGAICVTWRHDPHCDHTAAAILAKAACAKLDDTRLFFYPVWGWTLPPETEVGPAPKGLRFDTSHQIKVKRAAIAAHRSQTTDLIDDDPDGFRLAPEMIARLTGPYEVFLSDEPQGPLS